MEAVQIGKSRSGQHAFVADVTVARPQPHQQLILDRIERPEVGVASLARHDRCAPGCLRQQRFAEPGTGGDQCAVAGTRLAALQPLQLGIGQQG